MTSLSADMGARTRLRRDQESPSKDLVANVIESRAGITVPEHSAVRGFPWKLYGGKLLSKSTGDDENIEKRN